MSTAAVHFGGRPTGPDVRKLLEAFADKGPGDSISYESIGQIIGESHGSSRFETVVGAWTRALLNERNQDTMREAGANSVRILRESERTGYGVRQFRRHAKGIGRAYRKVALVRTELLDEAGQAANLFAKRKMAPVLESARDATKELATSLAPPKQLPRLVPGAK